MNVCGGAQKRLKIRPKAFALLNYLFNRSGQLVTKDELLNAVWPETFVGDAVLKVTVQQLREALEDDPKTPQFIETSHRRGYRFIGEIVDQNRAGTRSPGQLILPAHFLFIRGVVGREQAVGAICIAGCDGCMRGERQIGFITGEAGIGKTALVDAFARTIPADGTDSCRPRAVFGAIRDG